MQNKAFEMGGDPVQLLVSQLKEEWVEEKGIEAQIARLSWFRDIRAQKKEGFESHQSHPGYQGDEKAKVIDLELAGKEKQFDALESRFGYLTDEQINQVIEQLSL